MSYAGLGQVSGATVGRDGTRHESGGSVRVSARWAQRAANAGLRFDRTPPLAPLIGVDGKAGSVTIGALRALSHRMIATADGPVLNDPPLSGTTRWSPNVIMSTALESALARLAPVSDPPLSSATRRATTRTTTTGSSTTTTEPVPGATPVAPADEIILDEGSSSGAGGLIARFGIWPWAIGGAALVGVGLWFMSGGGMRANRRRVRRNSRRVRRNDGESFQSRLSLAWSLYNKGDKAEAKRELAEAKKLAVTKEDRFSAHKLDVRLSGYLGDPWGRGHRTMPSHESARWMETESSGGRTRRNSSSLSPFARSSSAGRRAWIVAVDGDYLKSYDWNPGFGVADYGVTKSQRDAMKLTHTEAKTVARDIHGGGDGPNTRVVQPGEGVRRNSSQGALEAKADELELERAALMRRAKKPGTPIDEKRSLNKRIYELIDEIAELGDRAETLRSAPR